MTKASFEAIINANKDKEKTDSIKNTIFKKESNELEYPELINIEIKKKKRNNLYGDYSADRPDLRDYD